MLKEFAITIAIVLLLSSGTFADIDQSQQFVIGTSNTGALSGAAVSALISVTTVPVVNYQTTTEGTSLRTTQIGMSSLVQGAAASSLASYYGYDQGASIVGTQSQTLSDYLSTGSQDQNLGASFTQQVYGIGSLGSAMAVQSYVGSQGQFITTPYGVNVEAQVIGVGIVDSTGGNASSIFSKTVTINHSTL